MKTILVSIMPTINNRRRPDLHYANDVSADLPDDAMGETIGECLRHLQHRGHTVGDDLIELQIRFG